MKLWSRSKQIEGLQQRNGTDTLIDIDRAVTRHDRSPGDHPARDEVGAAGASVVLKEPETGELRFFHCVGPTQAELVNVRIEPGQGVVGHCIDQAEVIYVADAYGDERFCRAIDDQTGFRTTSLLALPLITSAGVIGALELVNLPAGDHQHELLGLMEAFASQAAVALERAQLSRRLERRINLADAQLQASTS